MFNVKINLNSSVDNGMMRPKIKMGNPIQKNKQNTMLTTDLLVEPAKQNNAKDVR